RGGLRLSENEQRQQEQRVLRRDKPCGALDERTDVPDRVERGGTERLSPPQSTCDECDENRVQHAEQHEGEPREREAGRVAEGVTKRREWREDVQDSGWVEQQEVAIWDEPMEPRDRSAEIDAVVGVDDA